MFAANYYLPAQRIDEVQRGNEAQRNDETQPSKQRQSVSKPSHAARILGRRYALTATSFKYLEIGISVGSVPAVEIVIGDNRGTQLIFPYATWKTLTEKRADIQRLLDDSSAPLWVRGIAVQVCVINDSTMFKLTLADRYIYLMPSTIEFMFTLEHCIDHMYVWLLNNTHIVNSKVRNFVDVIREKNIIEVYNAAKAIRESVIFDCESLIDCELLACAIHDILCIAIK